MPGDDYPYAVQPPRPEVLLASSGDDYPYAVQPPRPEVLLASSAAGFDDRGQPLDPRLAAAAGWLAGLAILFMLANVAFVPLLEGMTRRSVSELAALTILGLIAAQVAIVPAVMVFAPGPLLLRTSICWLIAMLFCGAWLAGYVICDWQRYAPWQRFNWDHVREVAFGITLWLPAALLAFQAPLWALKLYFGWSLVREGDDNGGQTRPLAISDYMLAMVLVGATLALARGHAASYSSTSSPQDYWIPVLMIGPAGAIICLLGVASAMLLLLHFRNWRIGLAIMGVYCLALSLIPLIGRAAYVGHLDWIGWYEPLMLATPFLAWGAGLAACAAIVRSAGYRLRMGRARR